ncbi:MAG TPA: hypothetical protein GXZ82_02765 [Firmicutes bacterium]|jgi:hypothetical protein|nr:hypothetical protein [Bacillota bacterium]
MRIRTEYAQEAAAIPTYWLTDTEEVYAYLQQKVLKGAVGLLGHSAGRRPIWMVSYGTPREGKGTTTYSGSLGCNDVKAYLGPDYGKRVMLIIGGVHASEFEGIAGIVNLITVLEQGVDLRGKPWPDLVQAAEQLDRILLIPILNVDGRARLPIRMEPYRGSDNLPHQYLTSGAWLDGANIGWPKVKQYIPLDFSQTEFPGTYCNDGGVNLQHDDFFGNPQPETKALFDLLARERPDITLNMHTGAPRNNYYMRMLTPFLENALVPVQQGLYRHVHTALTLAGLQGSHDLALEADPKRQPPQWPFNLDSAINLHCGSLSVTIESPCHAFSGKNRAGAEVRHEPDALIDAQLVAYEAGMTFLLKKGGRCNWAPGYRQTYQL